MRFKTWDTETKGWNKLYAIGIYDGLHCLTMIDDDKKNDDFIRWFLDNLENGDICFAHFSGRFDGLFVMDFIKNTGEASISDISVIHGSIVSMDIRYKEKFITLRDSYNILPASLERLTKDFKVKHQKLVMDYEEGTKDARFTEYFQNDLIGLWEVLDESRELLSKLTIASNSMNTFLTKFYRKEFKGNYFKFDDIFRKAYMGGRTEIFRMVGENLNYYDVNSLYPSVMYENEYPIIENHNYTYRNVFDSEGIGLYKCKVQAPKDLLIPLLPYRTIDGKLLFPLGSFIGYYHTAEINKAKELGYKIDVLFGFNFNKTDFIFKDFVKHFYNQKKNAEGSRREIAKLYLNSLYGKFGMNRHQEEYTIVKPTEEIRHGVHVMYGMGKFAIKRTKIEVKFIPYLHSEIAGLITAHARLRLYDLIEKSGMENAYYCDTDSIITSSTLPTGSGLGELKQEAKIDKFIALAPKMYAYTTADGAQFKGKGIRMYEKKNGVRKPKYSFEDFEYAIKHNDLSKFVDNLDRLASFKERSTRNLTNYTSVVMMKKVLKKSYSKRIISSDLTTKPLTI